MLSPRFLNQQVPDEVAAIMEGFQKESIDYRFNFFMPEFPAALGTADKMRASAGSRSSWRVIPVYSLVW